MELKNLFIGIVMVAILTSCAKKEETADDDETTNTAKNIAVSDFSVSSSTYDNSSSSSSGVVYQINNDSKFYNNNPNSSSSSSCAFFNALQTAVFEADSDSTYKMVINDMSISDCFGSSSGITSSTGSYYLYGVLIYDSNGNNVNVNGKTLNNACSTSGCYYKSRGAKMYSNLIGSSSSGDVKLTLKQMYSESDGTACIATSTSLSSDCDDNYYNSTEVGSLSAVYIHKHTYKSGLIYSSSGTYYTGENINFKYNNWTGSMTYSSDNTSSAPTYSATNGTDNVSGTFTYSSSSRSNFKVNSKSRNNILVQKILNSFKKITL